MLNSGPTNKKPSRAVDVFVGATLGAGAGTLAGGVVLFAGGNSNAMLGAALVCVLAGAAIGGVDGAQENNRKRSSIDQRRIGTNPETLADYRLLSRYDNNGDGALNIDAEAIVELMPTTREIERDGLRVLQNVTSQADYTRLLRELDTNGDGDVVLSEAAAGYRRFDADGSGGIDATEGAAYAKWAEGLTDTKIIKVSRYGVE